MGAKKKTIKDWREEYLNDFLPSKKLILNQINAQHAKIMTGLIKTIQQAIPSGKWKTYFEKHFDCSLPWKRTVIVNRREDAKCYLYEMLRDRMPHGAGVCFFNVEKEEVLEAGFVSWKDFIESLKELNDAVGDICLFKYFDLGQEISADTSNIKLTFDTTLG